MGMGACDQRIDPLGNNQAPSLTIHRTTHLHKFLTHPIAVLVLVVGAVFALYGDIPQLWWCCDDPAILLHAQKYTPLEYFTVPQAWRALVPFSLTPWLSLVYDLDIALFGYEPRGFFVHHLLTLAGCAWLLHRIAARWTGEIAALVAPAMFLVGTPVAQATQLLMVRHYLEGLLFFLLAIWWAVRALDGGPRPLRWLATLAFAVSITAKEIFIPLGFIPFLLPLGSFRQRLAVAWPWLVVMALYVAWRGYMLGNFVGGYRPAADIAGNLLADTVTAFAAVPAMLWSAPLVATAGLAALAAAAAWRHGKPPGLLLLFWVVLLPTWLFAPLLPLVRLPGLAERYFIIPWAALSLICTLALAYAWRERPRWVQAGLLAAVLAVSVPGWLLSSPSAHAAVRNNTLFRAIGTAYLERDAATAIWGDPGVPAWFVHGLERLRPAMGRTGPPPLSVADESDLAGHPPAQLPQQVLRYSGSVLGMEDIRADVPAMLQRWRARLTPATLAVDVGYDTQHRVLAWKLEAPAGASFALLSNGNATAVPDQGQLRVEQQPQGCFRIRVAHADGRLSYSPLLPWPAAPSPEHTTSASTATARTRWAGPGDLFEASPPAPCPAQAHSAPPG